MSDIRNQTIVPPDLDDLLAELKNEIFANLNCIQIGKIESFNKDEQTAEVQIQVKRRIGGDEIKNYPLLVDCPVVVLQGGGAFSEYPISVGDYGLVIFCDRDIDNWWSAETVKEPLTTRKHSLSDGFILVGVNSKDGALTLEGDVVRLVTGDFPYKIESNDNTVTIDSDGIIIEDTNGNTITMDSTGVNIEDTNGNTIDMSTTVIINSNLEILQ